MNNKPTAQEMAKIFWNRLNEVVDIDDFLYDVISDYDYQFDEDDTDEKDSIRDQVEELIRFEFPRGRYSNL